MMKLILTEAALEDLRSVRTYTLEHWGTQQEELYLNSLWEKFETTPSDLWAFPPTSEVPGFSQ